MFSTRLFLTSTTLLVFSIACIQPVFAQNTKNPRLSEPTTVRGNANRGNAALIGPLEISSEPQTQRQLPVRSKVFTISPEPRVRIIPGPVLPGQVEPAYDRGIQVQVNDL